MNITSLKDYFISVQAFCTMVSVVENYPDYFISVKNNNGEDCADQFMTVPYPFVEQVVDKDGKPFANKDDLGEAVNARTTPFMRNLIKRETLEKFDELDTCRYLVSIFSGQIVPIEKKRINDVIFMTLSNHLPAVVDNFNKMNAMRLFTQGKLSDEELSRIYLRKPLYNMITDDNYVNFCVTTNRSMEDKDKTESHYFIMNSGEPETLKTLHCSIEGSRNVLKLLQSDDRIILTY